MPRLDMLDVESDIDYSSVSIKDVLLSSKVCRQSSPSPSPMFFSEMLQSTISPAFSKSISSTALDSFINAHFLTTPSPLKLGYPNDQPSQSSETLSFPEATRLSPLFSTDYQKPYSEFSPLTAAQQQTSRSVSNSPRLLNMLKPLLESPVVRRSLGDVTPPYQTWTRMSQRKYHTPVGSKAKTISTTATTTPRKKPSSPSARQLTNSPADRQQPDTSLNQMTSDTPFIDRLRQTTGKLFPASFSPTRRGPSYSFAQPLRSPFASDTRVEHHSVSDVQSIGDNKTSHLPFTNTTLPPSRPYLDFWASPLTEFESPGSSRAVSIELDPDFVLQTQKLGPNATCGAVLETLKKRPSTDDNEILTERQAKKPKLKPVKKSTKKAGSKTLMDIDNVTESILQPHFEIHTSRRTFPSNIPIREEFSTFYRQYPIIPFFHPNGANTSVLATRTTKRPPVGSIRNEPRTAYDLYTPRFTKGVGMKKVGLCPICFEPKHRGGNGTVEWLAMKVSAYKYYHLQYLHGISSLTGAPFSPPTAFRVHKRRSAEMRKHEKEKLLQGKCHKCEKWIAVEGVKVGEVKVKELYWWKHAASCHKFTTIPGETNIYIQDKVYDKLLEYEKSLTSQTLSS